MNTNCKLRKMLILDMPQVMGNERLAYSHPWSEGIFEGCLKTGNECWLVLLQDVIIGHGILSVAAGESHLLNICIRPDKQGNGYGKVLVEHLLIRAQVLQARRVFLEVRPSNLAAYKLYESLGFNEIGLRNNYYPADKGREDALVLAKELLPD